MPRTYTLTITFWLVLTTAGSVAGQTGDLAVRVYDYAGVPGKVMTAAEDEARRLLHRAGIETEWSGCPKNPNERDRYPNCQEPLGEADVILHVMPQPVEEYQVTSNGFGLTLQSGKGGIAEHVYVFYDRVKKTAGKVDQLPPATLLGYVIAHEIGHLLLGPDSHSSRGIMRARWGREDLEQMQRGKLAFLEEQAAIMRARLEQRTRIDCRAVTGWLLLGEIPGDIHPHIGQLEPGSFVVAVRSASRQDRRGGPFAAGFGGERQARFD